MVYNTVYNILTVKMVRIQNLMSRV